MESVCVEILARDLGVSKGSFYWHFRDRDDLLNQLLALWETTESEWLSAESTAEPEPSSAATRWARFVARSAEPERMRAEIAVRAWARRDPRVASRLSEVEQRKARVIAGILRDIGFATADADLWSQTALLVHLGWVDRSTRDPEFQSSGRSLGEFLSELVLAASARSASENS